MVLNRILKHTIANIPKLRKNLQSSSGPSLVIMPLRRKGVMLESKRIKMEVMADHPVPELDHSSSVVIGSPISRSVVKTSA